MQYHSFINEKGERIWLPLLAGAAIVTAPFWLGRNCCGNNQQYPYPYPYPVPYPYYNNPYSVPYPNYPTMYR